MKEPADQPSRRPRSRVEDEVLEILHRADRPTSFADHVRRRAHRRVSGPSRLLRQRPRLRLRRFNAAGALIGAFVVALAAILVHDASALLARLLALVSVALLLWPIIARYRAPNDYPKRWRGRDIDTAPRPPAWIESLRDRFRRPPRW